MGQFALRARQDVGCKMARYSTVTRERALQQEREAGVGLGGAGPVRVMPFRKRAIREAAASAIGTRPGSVRARRSDPPLSGDEFT